MDEVKNAPYISKGYLNGLVEEYINWLRGGNTPPDYLEMSFKNKLAHFTCWMNHRGSFVITFPKEDESDRQTNKA